MRSDNRESLREWRELASAWVRETRARKNASRDHLLDKPMLEACGDVRGLTVLGCG